MASGEGRLLLTVFEPFGGAVVNASQVVGESIADADPNIELLCLPVVAGEAERVLIERLAAGPVPSMVVSLGEAGPEPVIRLEKVAINYDDFRIPDNAGNQPRSSAIRADGPAAYFATLPLEAVADRLVRATPIPVKVSLTAGSFVCNHLAYAMLNWLASNPLCGYTFIHVPKWHPDGDMSLTALVDSVSAALGALRTA